MGFTIIRKPARNYGGEPTPTYRAYKLSDNLVGEIFIPASLVQELGWTDGMHFDIAQGDGEDDGWYALIPADRKAKAKLRKQGSTMFAFRERTLALGLETAIPRGEVMTRIEDGQFLFKRPDAQ